MGEWLSTWEYLGKWVWFGIGGGVWNNANECDCNGMELLRYNYGALHPAQNQHKRVLTKASSTRVMRPAWNFQLLPVDKQRAAVMGLVIKTTMTVDMEIGTIWTCSLCETWLEVMEGLWEHAHVNISAGKVTDVSLIILNIKAGVHGDIPHNVRYK